MAAFGKIEFRDRARRQEIRSVSGSRMSWSWLSAESVFLPRKTVEFRVKQEAAYLAIHDIVRPDGETRIEGGKYSGTKDLRGKLTFLPAGCTAEGWSDLRSRSSSVFAVHLAPLTHDAIGLAHLPPTLYFHNANLQATLLKLRSVIDGKGIADAAYAETLGLILVWELKNALLRGPESPVKMRGGLTRLQIRRIDEFIAANVGRTISIADLANLAGLSPFHFIRAFKDATGLSPYQHVLRERVERARQLLLNSDNSVADVAAAVGFGDALQLTRIFRKLVGTTPAAFRRENE